MGQPCIFYALESRSRKCLSYLLKYVKDIQCVIAYNGESVLHVATRMGDEGEVCEKSVRGLCLGFLKIFGSKKFLCVFGISACDLIN